MSITCFKLKMFESYIWNLTCRVNDNRIFLSWFFTIFHHFRNVSKERLRRRPVWQDLARTTVKLKRPHSYLQTISHDSFLVSLDSVYFVSFQAYSTLCSIKLYGVPDIVFDFQMIFSQDGHPNTKSMSLAKPQNVQENNAIHIDKRGCAVHTQVSIATSQIHRVAAERAD